VDDFINSRLPLSEDICLQLAAILVGARLGGSSLLNSYVVRPIAVVVVVVVVVHC
jgi:hypothetical protein